MKFLIIPTPSPGHLLAMVPFCWALRLAGHEVLVASRRDVADTAVRAGLHAAPLAALDVPLDDLRAVVNPDMFPQPLFADRQQPRGAGLWHITAQNWHRHAIDHLDAFAEVARDWGADVIVTDPLATIGRALGAELELPVVSHRWGIDPTGGPFTEHTAQLAAESAAPGGRALAEPVAVLDICPPPVQAPDAPEGILMRFVPYNGTGTLPEPIPKRQGRKRIAVCFGGSVLALTGARPLRAAVDALAKLPDADVVVALSPGERELLGEQPEHIRVVENLPLQLFLADCDALVHHGGSTTGLTGCWFGLPQLVLPQMFDQFDYAQGIVRAGVGRTAETRDAQEDIGGLADAVTALLEEPAYTAAAHDVGAALRTAADPSAVAEHVLAAVEGSDR
ncbi:nucleotide disphospho-sugar-binding domain-containing protein [Nocardia sp. CA-129566]|uniref:nucleotide disphospho-sugar-binding domain-containing protein n=1 Tax=Nocardia sp. CA-129566 TaxID=3239976 RepID=UPI003D960E8B